MVALSLLKVKWTDLKPRQLNPPISTSMISPALASIASTSRYTEVTVVDASRTLIQAIISSLPFMNELGVSNTISALGKVGYFLLIKFILLRFIRVLSFLLYTLSVRSALRLPRSVYSGHTHRLRLERLFSQISNGLV